MVRAKPRNPVEDVSVPGPILMDVPESHARAMRFWLLAVAVMIFATLIVGGATRLTESGLSITQWKPITGVVPPLSQSAWEQDFEKYQKIPQYQELNRGMTLAQYKVIYWYEWTHRILARGIGFVFLLPFLFSLWRGWAPKRLRIRLWALFGLLALQGAVGWWMVSSGLAGSGRVVVSQYRLAFHLTLACVLYLAVLWTAQQLAPPRQITIGKRLRDFALAIVFLLLGQIYLGALVAGTGAGHAYNTWPLIDGSFIPAADQLLSLAPAWRNFFENILTVQFDHRMLAYVIWLAIIFHAWDAWRSRRGVGGAFALAGIATVQVALGITTLLMADPLDLALTHQIVGIVVFTTAIVHAERLWHPALAAAPTVAATRNVRLELAE